ncbi:MAG: hypothetical protein DMG32_26330 [Acidobacteria bacterium]|nr:MAG: hypothetical protein DMG32_26330 [Acidobacteriota bacterium]
MSIVVNDSVEQFIYRYEAYPHQKAFHESPKPHRLLGGAAGPGKTLALIEDHMLYCNRFSPDVGPQVHTLILRRTYPKLASTVITRFREKIPKELYRDFNESQHIFTWRNGSTTQFGAMQHEHDVWGWQGQWYKIAYDELTEFTFPQWQNISAWNRCPVSSHPTKDGATNPIGIGAPWVEDVFVTKRPCAEMDANQKAQYKAEHYGYFPATYLDNPVYANDPQYIANLDSYQAAVSQALKMGIWGVAGGYFDGAWDEAYNVYADDSVEPKPYWRRWLGGDWGFDHNSVIHWFCMDDLGIVRIYDELVCNRHTPEMLADAIIAKSRGVDGKLENYELFAFSHDAFAQKQDVNPIGLRIGAVLQKAGLVAPSPSTKDKIGREQLLYDYLKGRIITGKVYNDLTGDTEPVKVAQLQIAASCENLIRTIPKAPRDEKNREEIAEFLGDDALQSSGYGLYAMFGSPRAVPAEVRAAEITKNVTDPTMRHLALDKFYADEAKKNQPVQVPRRHRHRKFGF